MPQSKYTNADLKRFDRSGQNVTIAEPIKHQQFPVEGLEGGDSIDQRLANAKGSLARAANFTRKQDEDIAAQDDYERRLAVETAWGNDIPSVTDSARTKLSKNARHYIATRPEVAETGALFGLLSPELAGPSAAILGLRSAANLAQGGTQRVTEHPFLTALDVAGLGFGGRAVKGGYDLLKPAAAVEEGASIGSAVKALKDLVSRKGAPGAVTQPQMNEMPLYAQMDHLPTRGSGAASGSRVGASPYQPSGQDMPTGWPKSWEASLAADAAEGVARTPSANAKFGYAGPSLPEPAAPRPSAFQQLSREGEFGGDRTTGSFDQHNLMTGKEEGYGALPRYRVEAEAAKPGIDLTGELNNAATSSARETAQARAAERFGRSFHDEGSTLPAASSGPRNPSSEVDLTEKLGELSRNAEREKLQARAAERFGKTQQSERSRRSLSPLAAARAIMESTPQDEKIAEILKGSKVFSPLLSR